MSTHEAAATGSSDTQRDSELLEALLDQMKTEAGKPMVDALRGDPCFDEFRLALQMACARDGEAEAAWSSLSQKVKTGEGRGHITSVLLLLGTLPTNSSIGNLMTIASARLCTLLDDSEQGSGTREAKQEKEWDEVSRQRAKRILESSSMIVSFLSGVMRNGEKAVQTMAGNEHAREWLMDILQLQVWDPTTALQRLTEVIGTMKRGSN